MKERGRSQGTGVPPEPRAVFVTGVPVTWLSAPGANTNRSPLNLAVWALRNASSQDFDDEGALSSRPIWRNVRARAEPFRVQDGDTVLGCEVISSLNAGNMLPPESEMVKCRQEERPGLPEVAGWASRGPREAFGPASPTESRLMPPRSASEQPFHSTSALPNDPRLNTDRHPMCR